MQPSGRARVLAAALLTAFLTALLAALLPVTTAQAADRRVAGGRLDWGIKSSFQSYVTGPIAHGGWNLLGGAATVGGSQFRFHSAQGSYDGDSGDFRAGFSGGVRFTGHRQADGSNQLDLTISRPTVRISGGSGTLYADMSSKSKETGKVTTSSQVPLASLALRGVDMRGGGSTVSLDSVPATLTAQGAKAFAGYYTAGTALDPVTLSADVAAAAKPTAAPTATPTPAPTATSSATAPGQPAITDAAVDWGVRRTFREYVTGPIAKGRWELSGGAEDGGALFRFGAGKGSYDGAKGTLDAAFSGTARFLGMEQDGKYGLDLALGAVRVTIAGGKGTLFANGAPFVTFDSPAASLAPKNGLVALTEVPTKLTAEGAKAFNGLYAAGTDMDPLTVSVALDRSAALPALPDLGTGATAAPSAAAAPRTPQPKAAAAESGAPVLPLTVLAAVLVAAAAGVFVWRRRSATTAPAPANAPDAPAAVDDPDAPSAP
ncbi:HtaA domain-containing protein [Streptomyces fildesensis]|uniref:HtaA domain-containing protein n=1 Tax=Streptomyces fildesensis TaxID=375757 RepID=A0ABW8CH22_9ACTN